LPNEWSISRRQYLWEPRQSCGDAVRVTDQREEREPQHHRARCRTNMANEATSFSGCRYN